MMILNKLRISYSIIGNFVELLMGSEQRIKNMLLDYEIQTKVDKLPDGREVKSLAFSKKNIRISFLPTRIDYQYGFPNASVALETTMQAAHDFYSLLGEIFSDIVGQRIAIVLNGFIENEDNKAIISFTDRMNLTTAFGECNELALKFNTPKQKEERINSVFNLDMGAATNSVTKQQTKVLLISFDANTLAENKENRFYASNFDHDFAYLIEEIKNRVEEIERF